MKTPTNDINMEGIQLLKMKYQLLSYLLLVVLLVEKKAHGAVGMYI